MCRLLPRDEETFLAVSGVGKRKAQQYGEAFTAVIGDYLAERRAADPAAEQ
jgi:ATP-dependent DNA helicase RecQ